MSRGRLVGLVTAAVAASALGLTWAVGSRPRPAPDLDRIARLAAAGQFDAAEAGLVAALRAKPDLDDAHLLWAQMKLDRPEPPTGSGQRPDPGPAETALNHLGRVRPAGPGRDALVRLYRGKAEYRLARLDAAEVSWLDALRLDPTVPEAGWCLLEMYYLEGRAEDSRRLALKLHRAEPDPRDRVQFLLELLRQDAQPLAPESVVQWFEPAARQAPDDLHVGLALGLARARSGKADDGSELLGRLAREHPGLADAWDAWLTGLDDAGDIEGLERALGELSPAMAGTARFARHEARLAQERGDIKATVAAYRRALGASPGDLAIGYRLARALRLSGDRAEADRLDRDHRALADARREARPIYEEANAVRDLGIAPQPDLYRRIADLRERMGLRDEARAWNRLVLRDRPDDPASLAAIGRLGDDPTESSR